nr:unnamed protein product [Microcystis aeruginosa PCC 7806]
MLIVISTNINPIMTVEPVAIRAWAEERMIYVELSDGRIIGFPGDRFRILKQATNEQLAAVKVEVNGYALRWEELDEDITVPGIVAGHFQLPPF